MRVQLLWVRESKFSCFFFFCWLDGGFGKSRALWWLILCHSKTRWDFIAFYCCGIYISALNNWCARQGITNNHAQLDSLLLSLEDTHKKRPKSNFLTSKWKSVASFSGRITSFSNLMFASKEIYNRKWSDSAFSAFIRLSKRITNPFEWCSHHSPSLNPQFSLLFAFRHIIIFLCKYSTLHNEICTIINIVISHRQPSPLHTRSCERVRALSRKISLIKFHSR